MKEGESKEQLIFRGAVMFQGTSNKPGLGVRRDGPPRYEWGLNSQDVGHVHSCHVGGQNFHFAPLGRCVAPVSIGLHPERVLDFGHQDRTLTLRDFLKLLRG